jgi:(p)ppGpp synthase/HD superfamily hydrolase
MAARDFPTFVRELPLTRRALDFAAARHHGQRRKADDAAFILHPLEVAQLLRNHGYPDQVVAAGVLHDSLEDTDATPEELERCFGAEVAQLVCAVSEPPGAGPFAERKARLRAAVADASPQAAAVYAADKVAKARELRMSLARDWSVAADPGTTDKLRHYWASLELLARMLGEHPLVTQLRFELEALETLPPRTPHQLAAQEPAEARP